MNKDTLILVFDQIQLLKNKYLLKIKFHPKYLICLNFIINNKNFIETAV